MGQIVAAMASSHAFAFLEPDLWDQRRQRTRNNYKRRYGVEVAEQPQVLEETLEDNQRRYKGIRDSLNHLRERIQTLRPDALVVIGDDQDENFREDNLPQFAIYIGEDFVAAERDGTRGGHYLCDAKLSRTILEKCVEAGIDLAYCSSFPKTELVSHAHREPLEFLGVADQLAIVPIFVNAIHVPGPSPARCYQFGKILRDSLESIDDGKRLAVYASGGLSHFTASYPWRFYQGPCSVGSICQDFDRKIVAAMREGRGAELCNLTSAELLQNGEPEFRQWMTLLGLIGNRRPELLTYEPFYRGLLGMAVGYWDLSA
jgi:hypothetical protein